MSPTWNPDEEATSGPIAEKIPEGRWHLTITKVLLTDKNGQPWRTRTNKDLQFLAVFENDDGAEATAFYPVEGKARWRLSRLIRGIGESTSSMAAKGMADPTLLAVKGIGDKFLVGKMLWADVRWDGKYHEIEPITEAARTQPQQGPSAQDKGAPVPGDDDIPF